MSMKELKVAISLADSYSSDAGHGSSASLIEKAESRLGCFFPPTYRAFLEQYGTGIFEGVEIYGLINEDFDSSGVPDCVWVTLRSRSHGMPDTLIIISSSGDGGYFALDSSKPSSDGEYPVVLYDIRGNCFDESTDFGNFFLEEIKAAIGYT